MHCSGFGPLDRRRIASGLVWLMPFFSRFRWIWPPSPAFDKFCFFQSLMLYFSHWSNLISDLWAEIQCMTPAGWAMNRGFLKHSAFMFHVQHVFARILTLTSCEESAWFPHVVFSLSCFSCKFFFGKYSHGHISWRITHGRPLLDSTQDCPGVGVMYFIWRHVKSLDWPLWPLGPLVVVSFELSHQALIDFPVLSTYIGEAIGFSMPNSASCGS